MDSQGFRPPPATGAADEEGDRDRRDSLFIAGRLTVAGDRQPRDVRVRNLSAGGMMVEFDRPVAIGTTLTIELRGIGAVAGRIAWCTDGRIGVALDAPIDPQLARKPVGGGERTPLYARPALADDLRPTRSS